MAAAMKADERKATIEVAYLEEIIDSFHTTERTTPIDQVMYWAPKFIEVLGDESSSLPYGELRAKVANLR